MAGSLALLGLLWCGESCAQQNVALAPGAHIYGIGIPGMPVAGGGLDGSGDVYASGLIGTSVTVSGEHFALLAPGPNSAVSGHTIALPSGNDTALTLLATGVHGNQLDQKFLVTYTDGSSDTFKQSLSDWFTPQLFNGESVALRMAGGLSASGVLGSLPLYLYAYSLPLNVSKTVQSLTLPTDRNVIVLAANLTPAGSGSSAVPVSLAATAGIVAIAAPGATVPQGGLDGSGDAYDSKLLGSSLNVAGASYHFGAPESSDAASGVVIPLPSGKEAAVNLLATAVHGSQLNQTFTVTYTDGSTERIVQSLSDWFNPQRYQGESIALTMADRTTLSGATDARPFNLYGYSFPLDATRTVKGIALPANRNVVVLAMDLIPSSGSSAAVSLNGSDNVFAIDSQGTRVTSGGLDGHGDTYAANLLGSSLSYSGATFSFARPGPDSAVTSKTLALPVGLDSSLRFLATGVNGNQPSQTFTVNYTDGTKATFVQSMSDWFTPQYYSGEAVALSMDERVTDNGGIDPRQFNLYAYTIPLDSTKSVQSLTLPSNPNVVVLAVDLFKATVAQSQAAPTPTFSVPGGAYSAPQSVLLQDTIPGATIYYTFDGSTPTTASPKYTDPIEVFGSSSASTLVTTLKAIAAATGYTTSSAASATYIISLPIASSPNFVPSPDLPVANALLVTMTGQTSGEGFLYTTDGTIPLPSSLLYSGPFTAGPNLSNQAVIQAIGAGFGLMTSSVTSVTYNFAELPSDGLLAATNGGGIFLDNPNQASYGCSAQGLQNGTCQFNGAPPPGLVGCAYYQSVGLMGSSSCNPIKEANTIAIPNNDNYYISNGEDWLTSYQNLANNPLTSNSGDISATFVNIMDLNFTRQHHAAVFGGPIEPGVASAAYVCNSPGPDFYHSFAAAANPGVSSSAVTQAVDTAISNAPSGPGDAPCVAIDYGLNPGSGTNAYMRFLAFDKNHHLLVAVDLDGRGPKDIPDACSACHGLPPNAPSSTGTTLQAPGQASYIPFDEENLLFSMSNPALSQQIQEGNIWLLNQIVLNGQGTRSASDPIVQLINGWYPGSGFTQQTYVPTLLTNTPDATVYQEVYAPFCRSCHVANAVNAYPPPQTPNELNSLFSNANVCNPPPTTVSFAIMPNSKVTYDRFWATHLNPTAYSVDFPQLLANYLNCPLSPSPPKRHQF